MNYSNYLKIITILSISLFLSSCYVAPKNSYMANKYGNVSNYNDIKVRVSLNNRAVYVYEGNEPRFVAAVAIGKHNKPTPKGHFKAFNKIAKKRSNTYGFYVGNNQIIPGKRVNKPDGYKYVGYPMPWWVEFKSAYGFHAGSVWPTPRTHGCLRLHKTVAKDFFQMVKAGTPIYIADSLPEDSSSIGRNIPRPTDYADPDLPRRVLITNYPFES